MKRNVIIRQFDHKNIQQYLYYFTWIENSTSRYRQGINLFGSEENGSGYINSFRLEFLYD